MCPLQLHANTLHYSKKPPAQQLPSRESPTALCHCIFILKGEWGRAEPSETFELICLIQSTKYLLIIPHNSTFSMGKEKLVELN